MYSDHHFQIKSFQADKNGNMSIPSLFLFMQEAAWENAAMNNMGFDDLNVKNSFWVLSRVYLEIDTVPNWKDEISVKTWPNGYDGFIAIRDFEIMLNNSIVARAKTNWLILDKLRHRPQKIDDFNLGNLKNHLRDAVSFDFKKINIASDLEAVENRKVFFSDIDVNKHVNNAEYVKWVLDSFYADYQYKVKSLEVNYLSELVENDEFTIFKADLFENKCYYVIKKANKDVCKVLIGY